MAYEQNQRCAGFASLLIRKVSSDLGPDAENALKNHLAQCAACNSELENLTRLWREMEALPSAAVPPKLHDETLKAVSGLIRQERAFFRRLGRDFLGSSWSYLLPVITGLVMTALSYGLMANLIDHRIHHHYIVIAVVVFWGMLFVAASWLIFRNTDDGVSPVSATVGFSLSITFITLLLARLFSWGEVSGWIDVLLNGYLPETAQRFVLGWGSYACSASFLGAVLFRLHKASSLSQTAFRGALFISVLLFPVLYLHGSSHSHGIGVIFFGSLGVFFASSGGIILGSMIRHESSLAVI